MQRLPSPKGILLEESGSHQFQSSDNLVAHPGMRFRSSETLRTLLHSKGLPVANPSIPPCLGQLVQERTRPSTGARLILDFFVFLFDFFVFGFSSVFLVFFVCSFDFATFSCQFSVFSLVVRLFSLLLRIVSFICYVFLSVFSVVVGFSSVFLVFFFLFFHFATFSSYFSAFFLVFRLSSLFFLFFVLSCCYIFLSVFSVVFGFSSVFLVFLLFLFFHVATFSCQCSVLSSVFHLFSLLFCIVSFILLCFLVSFQCLLRFFICFPFFLFFHFATFSCQCSVLSSALWPFPFNSLHILLYSV